jgi:hypothetical protein
MEILATQINIGDGLFALLVVVVLILIAAYIIRRL